MDSSQTVHANVIQQGPFCAIEKVQYITGASLWFYLIVQSPCFGHGWERTSFATYISEDLEYHEAEKKEIETGADARNYDKGHLTCSCQGKH